MRTLSREQPGSSRSPTELSVEILPEKLLGRNFQSPWQSPEEFGCGSETQLGRLCGGQGWGRSSERKPTDEPGGDQGGDEGVEGEDGSSGLIN